MSEIIEALEAGKEVYSKDFGVVTKWHVIPDWTRYRYRLLVQFDGKSDDAYTLDGMYPSNYYNGDCDLKVRDD